MLVLLKSLALAIPMGMFFLATGCTDESGLEVKLFAEGKALTSSIDRYKSEKGGLPDSLADAYNFSKSSIQGNIRMERWTYLRDHGNYVIVGQLKNSDSIVIATGNGSIHLVEINK